MLAKLAAISPREAQYILRWLRVHDCTVNRGMSITFPNESPAYRSAREEFEFSSSFTLTSPPACRSWPTMQNDVTLELDHIFIMCAAGAPEAVALARLGVNEGSGNTHPGQGTACRRFFFQNQYLELVCVCDPDEARNEAILNRRALGRVGRAALIRTVRRLRAADDVRRSVEREGGRLAAGAAARLAVVRQPRSRPEPPANAIPNRKSQAHQPDRSSVSDDLSASLRQGPLR